MSRQLFQGLTIDLPESIPLAARDAALRAALYVLDLRGVLPGVAVTASYVPETPGGMASPDDPDVEIYAMQPGEWEWSARVAATKAAIAALADHGFQVDPGMIDLREAEPRDPPP